MSVKKFFAGMHNAGQGAVSRWYRQVQDLWQELYESCSPSYQGVRLPDAEVMYRLVNAVQNLMANNIQGIKGFEPGSNQHNEVFESVKVAMQTLGWELHKRLTPEQELLEAERLGRAKAVMEASIGHWGVPREIQPGIAPRAARTPEETEHLVALSNLFSCLSRDLLRWAATSSPDGDLAQLPPREAALLALFDAAWCLFDGHTRDSGRLRAKLQAAGEYGGFEVHFHLPIDAEESAWLKAHGIADSAKRSL